ncbi:DUF1659 domain-containing protein [Tindallia californiensis]|uniref:DUF1659 domain-containing protein n=1 Tax=Tindallia californiensis TaxID=159292 RepID=A0A1H3I3W6_9FIRM|nr:DUF1659 domain-containing protein [Tindallia californiensis]SDY22361.1 Protein of unknown function [Tindallia californiensis]
MDAERAVVVGQLQLRFIDSIVDGAERYMTRTFSGIKAEAEDSAVLAVAYHLMQLQTKNIKTITRIERAEIIEG